MPTTFDKQMVQRLIDTAEQGQNANILKFGYFFRFSQQSYPPMDAFHLLETSVLDEPRSTRRWWVLQSVFGFAGIRLNTEGIDDGFQAYQDMFSGEHDARKAGAEDVLQNAVNEYVSSVPGKFGAGPTYFAGKAREVLLLALGTSLQFARQAKAVVDVSPWSSAITYAGADAQYIDAVDKVLNDSSIPKTYALYRIAAAIYQHTQVKRAIEFLQHAKQMLPKDKLETNDFYSELVKLLEADNRLDEAVAAQQELIRITGEGQASLAAIYHKKADERSFHGVIEALQRPDAGEQDINDAARLLLEIATGEPYNVSPSRAQAANLLMRYLCGARHRDVDQDLQARWTLAHIYLQQNNLTKAVSTLTVKYSPSDLVTSSSQRHYAAINRLLAAVSTRIQTGGERKDLEPFP